MAGALKSGDQVRPSSLLWFVLAAVAAGIYGFSSAGGEHPAFALSSNLIYRSEIGLAFLASIYVVGIAVWLAWFGKGFLEINVAGSGIRASDPEMIGGVAQELVDMSSLIAAVKNETKDNLEDLDRRLQMVERR